MRPLNMRTLNMRTLDMRTLPKRTLDMRTLVVGLVLLAQAPASAQPTGAPTQQVPAGSVAATGKVLGPDAAPKAGMALQVQGPIGKTHVFTSADGTWSLYNLPAGQYEVKPVDGASADKSVNFTVQDAGFFDKLTGGGQKAVVAPQLTIDK